MVSRRQDITVRDDLGRKFCHSCQSWLPESSFFQNRPRRDGLHWCCRRCQSFRKLLEAYGLSRAQFEKLMEEQGYRCPVCTLPFGDRTPAVDHDHACCPGKKSCGKCVRGLLCLTCNTGIGMMKESTDNMTRAIRYLTKEQW